MVNNQPHHVTSYYIITIVRKKQADKHRRTDRQTQTDRDRHSNKHTQTQLHRQIDSQTDRQMEGETDKAVVNCYHYLYNYRHTHCLTIRVAYSLQRHEPTDRETDGHRQRHTETEVDKESATDRDL